MGPEPIFADKLLTAHGKTEIVGKQLSANYKRRAHTPDADSLHPQARRRKTRAKATSAVYPYELHLSDLLTAAAASSAAADNLKGLVHFQRSSPNFQWRGYSAIPPGSLLECICHEFSRGTSIPLEIPFAHMLGYAAGYLCQRGVHLVKGNARVDPTLWTIMLADSGAGKTWTTKRIRSGCQIEDSEIPGISGCVSAAMLFDTIHNQPTGLWLHDEFGQFVSRLDKNPQDTEMKEYLLKLYDGDGLIRGTKKDGERHTGPTRICILGMSQHATWNEMLPPRAMLDGFAQRFSYWVVRDDPARDYRNYADWSVDTSGWTERWQECVRAIQPQYFTSEEAMLVYKQAFFDLAHKHLPQSFYRRLMFASHRLAMIYHVLLCDSSPMLTAIDYGWALRLTRMFLEDCIGVIGENSVSELQRAIVKAHEIGKRMTAKGRTLKPRDLVSNMRCIKTASEAEGLLRLISATP